MHNLIIQLSTKPVPEDERLSEFSLEREQYCGFADYISQREPEIAIQDVAAIASRNKLGDVDQASGKLVITPQQVNEYFYRRYQKFREALANVEAKICTVEQFSSLASGYEIFKLKESFDATTEAYVYDDDLCLRTLDYWLRRNIIGGTFYIGGTLDYHW